MLDIYELMHGDRVRIVSKWGPNSQHNPYGLMDHWLGQIMTVREVYGGHVKMMEDIDEYDGNTLPGWNWDNDMIECIVYEEDWQKDMDFCVNPLSSLYETTLS